MRHRTESSELGTHVRVLSCMQCYAHVCVCADALAVGGENGRRGGGGAARRAHGGGRRTRGRRTRENGRRGVVFTSD